MRADRGVIVSGLEVVGRHGLISRGPGLGASGSEPAKGRAGVSGPSGLSRRRWTGALGGAASSPVHSVHFRRHAPSPIRRFASLTVFLFPLSRRFHRFRVQ